MKSFKNTTVLLAFTIGLCYLGVSVAHEAGGTLGRKNKKAEAVDILGVSCSDDNNGAGASHHLYLDVSDLRPRNPARISAKIVMPSTGAISEVTTDLYDSDGNHSNGIELAGGDGQYQIIVTKSKSSKKGVEVYALDYHCENAEGKHTGTSEPLEVIQNQ